KAHEGYVMPETQKRKIAASNKGKPKSPEAIAKTLRIRQERGAYFSPATCEKYGLSLILPPCVVCGGSFHKTRGVKTCGSACAREACRRAAQKRWGHNQLNS